MSIDQIDPPLSGEESRLLIEAVTDYAIFALTPTGVIRSWNSGAKRIKGYAAEEVIGRHVRIFYTGEDSAAGVPDRALEDARKTGRFESEGWRIRHDGSRFWANVVIDSVTDDNGDHVGFVKITRDETERHDLAEAQAKMARMQRIEQIGELTGGVAHDFNNILTAILGCLEMLSPNATDQRLQRIAEVGIAATKRGQKLVAQLMSFSRQQVLVPQPTDINDAITQISELVSQAIGSTIELNLSLSQNVPMAKVDPAHFQSALLNLIFNARDAMPEGGELMIRTGVVELSHDEHVGRSTHDSRVFVEVVDFGSGMTPEVLAHAIDPFFTTKKRGHGSGLGLSQVHGFAAQSGGELILSSTIGEGTSVRLLLPSTGALPDERRASQSQRAAIVVDDNELVLEVVAELLRLRGDLVVYAASNAAGALAILERDKAINLLLTDIVMPGMNGLQLAEKTRTLRPDVKVLLGSGYSSEKLRGTYDVPANSVLMQKPYDRRDLDAAIDRALQDDASRITILSGRPLVH